MYENQEEIRRTKRYCTNHPEQQELKRLAAKAGLSVGAFLLGLAMGDAIGDKVMDSLQDKMDKKP